MLARLAERLGSWASRLRKQARISPQALDAALREVRIALLEADVALAVARELIAKAKEELSEERLARSLTPGDLVVQAVHRAMVEIMGGRTRPLDLSRIPSVVLLVGLQGSGKTTTAGKLARWVAEQRKKVALASVDATRPAAREQLARLAEQLDVPFLALEEGDPVAMAKEALDRARREGHHVLVLDTAGRQAADEAALAEAKAIAEAVQPVETLIVVDATMGQSAAELARAFAEAVPLTGVILSKADADARGGAALSVARIAGVPVRFLGVGEKLDALEPFDARRFAGRILGYGDIEGLLARVAKATDEEKAKEQAKRLRKGEITLDDFAAQLDQLLNAGGAKAILEMLPGQLAGKLGKAEIDERTLRRMRAIIQSMTREERRNPEILNGSRKRRIARGAGVSVQEVNQLLRQYRQMRTMLKRAKGMKRAWGAWARLLGMPGGLPR